jgi:hypothetical protein
LVRWNITLHPIHALANILRIVVLANLQHEKAHLPSLALSQDQAYLED